MSPEKTTLTYLMTFLVIVSLSTAAAGADITLIPHSDTGMGDLRSEMVASAKPFSAKIFNADSMILFFLAAFGLIFDMHSP